MGPVGDFLETPHNFSKPKTYLHPMPLVRRFAPKRLGWFQQPGGLGGKYALYLLAAIVANKGLGWDVLLKIFHVILVVTSQ